MYYASISVNFITAKYELKLSKEERYRYYIVHSQRCNEMNLCNYRAQIGLAPHEAALDLLITRCAERQGKTKREREGEMATIQFICQK